MLDAWNAIPGRRKRLPARRWAARRVHVSVGRLLCPHSTYPARPGGSTGGFCDAYDCRGPDGRTVSNDAARGRSGHHRAGVGPNPAFGEWEYRCELVSVTAQIQVSAPSSRCPVATPPSVRWDRGVSNEKNDDIDGWSARNDSLRRWRVSGKTKA
jgi:hypothetical protein